MNDNHVSDYYRGNRIEAALTKQSSKENCLLSYNSFVGVEIEGEGIDAGTLVDDDKFNSDASSYWRLLRDGSLRGLNFEAVFSKPYSGYKVQIALRKIDELLSKYEVDFNPRTSVHVHINVQDMTIAELSRFYAIYLIFEDALFNYVGYGRSNSNYCTKLADDEFAVGFLRALEDKRECVSRLFSPREPGCYHDLGDEDEAFYNMSKYHALNVRTLGCFGTFEFRHHPGDHDKERLFEWINILLKMKKWAVNAAIDTRELPMYVSSASIYALCQEVFEEYSDKIAYDGMEHAGYVGVRSIQAAFMERRGKVFREPCEKSIVSRLKKKAEEERAIIHKKIHERFSEDRPGLVDFLSNGRYKTMLERDIAMELYYDFENQTIVEAKKPSSFNFLVRPENYDLEV